MREVRQDKIIQSEQEVFELAREYFGLGLTNRDEVNETSEGGDGDYESRQTA
jgi:hypothetical protein